MYYGFEPFESSDSIIIVTESGEKRYARSKNNKLDLNPIFNGCISLYYHLEEIDPEAIINNYDRILNSNNFFINTSLLYIDNIKMDSVYTNQSIHSLRPLYSVPQKVGIGDEISLQCYVDLPIKLILANITGMQWGIVTGWFLLLILLCYYFIHQQKKIYKNVLASISSNISFKNNHSSHSLQRSMTSQHSIVLTKQLKFDKTTDTLYIDKESYVLKGKSHDLFLAFINAPDYTLSIENIRHALWGKEFRSDEAIRSCISRLKKDLLVIENISIINYPGKGYKMIIRE